MCCFCPPFSSRNDEHRAARRCENAGGANVVLEREQERVYWGDDIGPTCVTTGCYHSRQKVQKDRATWYRMSDELSQLISRTMGDRETFVVLENEFNKNGVETYEPFDAELANVAAILHRRGNVKVVLGFGNWAREHWKRSTAPSPRRT